MLKKTTLLISFSLDFLELILLFMQQNKKDSFNSSYKLRIKESFMIILKLNDQFYTSTTF